MWGMHFQCEAVHDGIQLLPSECPKLVMFVRRHQVGCALLRRSLALAGLILAVTLAKFVDKFTSPTVLGTNKTWDDHVQLAVTMRLLHLMAILTLRAVAHTKQFVVLTVRGFMSEVV